MSVTVNRRALATLLVFLLSLIIVVTSILMFFKSHNNTTTIVHTVVGFIFLAAACWHLINNFASLKKAIHPSAVISTASRFGWSPRLALFGSLLLLILTTLEVEPFKSFHRWGTRLRMADSSPNNTTGTLEYTLITQFKGDETDRRITIDFKKGSAFHWPQYAIWVEKPDGTFVQPLYVTESVATNTFKNTVWLKEGIAKLTSNPFDKEDFSFETIFGESYNEKASNNRFRPESLPVFLHKLKQSSVRNNMKDDQENTLITEQEKQQLDGYTGATLLNNYLLSSSLKNPQSGKYTVFLEINQSFDFNDYYSSDRFPDDKIYSGDGFSAQPSVVYQAQIDFDSPTQLHPMTLVGHGHHSGQNGEIDINTENLTTALAIVDRIIVDIR